MVVLKGFRVLWYGIPIRRVAILAGFAGTLYVFADGSLASDSIMEWVQFASLSAVALLYLLLDSRSEVWLLFTVCVVVAFLADVVNGVEFTSASSRFRFQYQVFLLFYACGMSQLFDHLFQNQSVSTNMLIFINIMVSVVTDLYDIHCMAITTVWLQSYGQDMRISFELYPLAIVCISLALLLHSQSFPSTLDRTARLVTDIGARKNALEMNPVTISRKRVVATKENPGAAKSLLHPGKPTHSGCSVIKHAWKCVMMIGFLFKSILYYPKTAPVSGEYYAVLTARKRSAMVSLLFVDTPFFLIRLMILLYSNTPVEQELVALTVKNVINIFLHSNWLMLAQKEWISRATGKHTVVEIPIRREKVVPIPEPEKMFADLLDWSANIDLTPRQRFPPGPEGPIVRRPQPVLSADMPENSISGTASSVDETSPSYTTRTPRKSRESRILRVFIWRSMTLLIGTYVGVVLARKDFYSSMKSGLHSPSETHTILGIVHRKSVLSGLDS